jgi:hypothetical protein
MYKVVQVQNAASAQAYLNANPNIDCCFYYVPFKYTDKDGRVHLGEENQGYPCTRVYVKR